MATQKKEREREDEEKKNTAQTTRRKMCENMKKESTEQVEQQFENFSTETKSAKTNTNCETGWNETK